MKYKIVLAGNPDDLEGTVNEHLLQGWRPQGGTAVVYVPVLGSPLVHYQALVREEPTAKEVEQASWESWTERVKALLVEAGLSVREPDSSPAYQKQMRALLKIYLRGQTPEVAVSELLRGRRLMENRGG